MGIFTDKTAVITGASAEGGSGWVIAEKLAEAGARVIVSARSRTAIERLARQIGGVAVPCAAGERGHTSTPHPGSRRARQSVRTPNH